MSQKTLMYTTAMGLLTFAVSTTAGETVQPSVPSVNTTPLAVSTGRTPTAPMVWGSQLMTPSERLEHYRRMMSARTPEERAAYLAEHHRQMQERAAAAGLTLAPVPGGYGNWGGGPHYWTWQGGYGYGPGYAYNYGRGYVPGYGPPWGYWHVYCPTCPNTGQTTPSAADDQCAPTPGQIVPETGTPPSPPQTSATPP
jgi:hypothetical protein